MREDKIQIDNSQRMEMAVGSIRYAAAIMATFDWEHLQKAMEFGEGIGAVLDPDTFMQIQRDPQWELKKRMVKAAATFIRELEAVDAQINPGDKPDEE